MSSYLRASCAVFALIWSAITMAATPVSQTRTFHLEASPHRVMPLFTATGERAWAKGWDPQFLSGDSARGSVFRTSAHGRDAVWIVIDYRPERGIASYARIVLDHNMGLVDVSCVAAHHGSDVTVTYTLTPLSRDGAGEVAAMLDPSRFDAMIEEWRTAIGAALAKGMPPA